MSNPIACRRRPACGDVQPLAADRTAVDPENPTLP